MSMRALVYAVRDLLRAKFPFKEDMCDVMIDGMPPAYHGDRFVVIHGTQWTPGPFQPEQGLDEFLGFTVTITFAIGVAPQDERARELVYKECDGIEQWARRITELLTRYRWEIMCDANAKIREEICGCVPAVPEAQFISPAVWAGNDASPKFRGPDWLSSDPGMDGMEDGDDPNFAIVMDVRYHNAHRIHTLEELQA